MNVILRNGSVNCPKDKTALLWNQFCGMRLYREIDGVMTFRAKCPKCTAEYNVRAK